MDFMDNSESPYVPSTEHEAQDIPSFLIDIENLPEDTVIGWRNNRKRTAHPGIWIRRGMYKLKHGSFVDPSDLSCYAAQFYVADPAGRHDCVQIGHGLEGPDDSTPIETVGELRSALAEFAPVADGADDASAEACESAEFADSSQDTEAPEPEYKILQPDGAFELHGSLTRGWRAVEYVQENEDGSSNVILVFD